MWELYHGLHDGTYGEYLGILQLYIVGSFWRWNNMRNWRHARFAEAMVRFGILRPSWWERVDIGES